MRSKKTVRKRKSHIKITSIDKRKNVENTTKITMVDKTTIPLIQCSNNDQENSKSTPNIDMSKSKSNNNQFYNSMDSLNVQRPDPVFTRSNDTLDTLDYSRLERNSAERRDRDNSSGISSILSKVSKYSIDLHQREQPSSRSISTNTSFGKNKNSLGSICEITPGSIDRFSTFNEKLSNCISDNSQSEQYKRHCSTFNNSLANLSGNYRNSIGTNKTPSRKPDRRERLKDFSSDSDRNNSNNPWLNNFTTPQKILATSPNGTRKILNANETRKSRKSSKSSLKSSIRNLGLKKSGSDSSRVSKISTLSRTSWTRFVKRVSLKHRSPRCSQRESIENPKVNFPTSYRKKTLDSLEVPQDPYSRIAPPIVGHVQPKSIDLTDKSTNTSLKKNHSKIQKRAGRRLSSQIDETKHYFKSINERIKTSMHRNSDSAFTLFRTSSIELSSDQFCKKHCILLTFGIILYLLFGGVVFYWIEMVPHDKMNRQFQCHSRNNGTITTEKPCGHISHMKKRFHEYLKIVEQRGETFYELSYQTNSTSEIFINHDSDLFDQDFSKFLEEIYKPLKNYIERERRSKWTFIQALFYSGSWAGDWEMEKWRQKSQFFFFFLHFFNIFKSNLFIFITFFTQNHFTQNMNKLSPKHLSSSHQRCSIKKISFVTNNKN